MAVFLNRKRKAFALVSYKAMYSRFLSSPQWERIGEWPTTRMFMRHIVKHRVGKTFQLLRHPESRCISFFMDKFRIQPSLCDADDFAWQPCHNAFLSAVGMTRQNCKQEIADAFLRMTFDQLIELLPSYYALEPHTWPQAWTMKCRFRGRMLFAWPGVELLRMEDGLEALRLMPDVNFAEKTNASSYRERDFVVTEHHRDVLSKTYAVDYKLGGYSRQSPSST